MSAPEPLLQDLSAKLAAEVEELYATVVDLYVDAAKAKQSMLSVLI